MNNMLRAKNFTIAAIKHFLNGSPTCTQEEIDKRLTICKRCYYFSGWACAHKSCGCNINDQQIYLNKLAWKDQACPLQKWGVPAEKLVTACITTFKRPQALIALQASIRKFYPELKQVVVDTQGNLSWGRNYAIKQVTTPFVLILEDDFSFTEKTNIERLLLILQEDDELGGVGGEVGGSTAASDFEVFRKKLYLHPATRFRDGYVICNYINNFMLCRRELFEKYQWDEDLEIHEHITFFYNVWRGEEWRFALAKDVSINHNRPRPTPEYKKFRKRNFTALAQNKLKLSFQPVKESFRWP